MKLTFKSKVELNQYFSEVSSFSSNFSGIKASYVPEALSYALGFNTKAAIYAFLEENKSVECEYDSIRFIDRLCKLTHAKKVCVDDILVVNEIAKGTSIKVNIEKGTIRNRSGYVPCLVHKVTIKVTGKYLNSNRIFTLPHFKNQNGNEPYRVDHAYFHRVDEGKLATTRNHSGKQLLTGRLIDGGWVGELFVYSSAHENDDSKMLINVKRSLLRAVGSTLSTEVNVRIYTPDNYGRDHHNESMAYRVEIDFGAELIDHKVSRISFNLPNIDQAKFHITEEKYKLVRQTDIQNIPYDALFTDGFWHGDLYFYGKSPDWYDESMVKLAILRNVYRSLSSFN
ncbi:hypothetical protein [Providencia sp. PROV266]|uniref:hypothetical protein n=1 Tax=Providencia sp. PROV266 TaxID=2949954 RepID=UPI00234A0F81|nr:hypothetical protein [Providencia sp. PROV266]